MKVLRVSKPKLPEKAPATYCVACDRVWAFWVSIWRRPITVIDCGVSTRGVLVLVAVAERVAT